MYLYLIRGDSADGEGGEGSADFSFPFGGSIGGYTTTTVTLSLAAKGAGAFRRRLRVQFAAAGVASIDVLAEVRLLFFDVIS